MIKWIILFAIFWWLGRLVRWSLASFLGLGSRRRKRPDQEARTGGADDDKSDYDKLTRQKISDADFEEIDEE